VGEGGVNIFAFDAFLMLLFYLFIHVFTPSFVYPLVLSSSAEIFTPVLFSVLS